MQAGNPNPRSRCLRDFTLAAARGLARPPPSLIGERRRRRAFKVATNLEDKIRAKRAKVHQGGGRDASVAGECNKSSETGRTLVLWSVVLCTGVEGAAAGTPASIVRNSFAIRAPVKEWPSWFQCPLPIAVFANP